MQVSTKERHDAPRVPQNTHYLFRVRFRVRSRVRARARVKVKASPMIALSV